MRTTLALDPDVVETFGDPAGLSATVNGNPRHEMQQRQRRGEHEVRRGRGRRVRPTDPATVERIRRALG